MIFLVYFVADMESFLQLFNSPDDKNMRTRKRQWDDSENEGNGVSDCETSSVEEDQEVCLPPEPEHGNIEYKLKLINPSSQRFEHLVTQMKWRLKEGQGEAIYQIGTNYCMAYNIIVIRIIRIILLSLLTTRYYHAQEWRTTAGWRVCRRRR